MSKSKEIVYQFSFGEELPKILSYFPEGTMIYPKHFKQGPLHKKTYVERLGKGTKIKGLTAYRGLEEIQLYQGVKQNNTILIQILPKDTTFGAYAKNEKRVKL